jgi:hypothetical protein
MYSISKNALHKRNRARVPKNNGNMSFDARCIWNVFELIAFNFVIVAKQYTPDTIKCNSISIY